MASRAKPSAPATRSSTRTKTPPGPSSSPPLAIKGIKQTRSATATAAGASAAKTATPRRAAIQIPNSPDAKRVASKQAGKPPSAKSGEAEQEPIMAYLRIRPRLSDDEPANMPYLDTLSETAVRMTDPSSDGRGTSGMYYRASTTPPSSIYRFSHVFLPSTQQASFFAKTTLPLVQDLLAGQNGLLFTYGVTNSGKTYTIQGGIKSGSAGILPRTLDVIFNSIGSLQGDGRYRPVRLQGVEEVDPSDFTPPPINIDVPNESALAEVFTEHMGSSDDSDIHTDPTVIKLDRNHEYSVWISYVEVYNEKVYDLLDSVNDDQEQVVGAPRMTLPGQGANTIVVTRKALGVKPCPAHDAVDDSGSGNMGRYISGLRQFRVTSATQAKALVKLGQLHRRVFGTLANSQSSRSHSVITLKVLRNHRGDRDDPSSVQISRLTLVDLAGSERTKHTQTSGERLKEAGSINKSLMVLGQCMEVMRSNQRRLAQSLANVGQSDTRDVKKAVVPFRHSKLTEILMDYFAGDGRIVMIVNVNPYDTGFDENSHVMKFSALARDISTVVNNAPIPRIHTKHDATAKPSALPRAITRKVTISSFIPGKKLSEAHLEVLEEDEEVIDDQVGDEDDEPINPLVDALFDEIEDLRLRLYEAEMRSAIVEAETREEVMREMEQRMRAVERTYARRLMSEVESNERKIDAKIDMLHQAGLLGITGAENVSNSESEIEDIVGNSESKDSTEECEIDVGSSPFHGKGNSTVDAKTREHQIAQPTEATLFKGTKSDAKGNDTASENMDEDEDEYSTNDDASDDYIPPVTAKNAKGSKKANTGKRPTKSVSKLEQEIKGLLIGNNALAEADDSVIILPSKAGKGETDPIKKKKRQLGKKSVVTEDEMEVVVGTMEQKTLRQNVRRMRAS